MVAYHPEAFGCESIRAGLSEVMDGELDAHATARLALHLACCPPCARFAAELALVIVALRRRTAGARRVPVR